MTSHEVTRREEWAAAPPARARRDARGCLDRAPARRDGDGAELWMRRHDEYVQEVA
jgi:hypothetical protein